MLIHSSLSPLSIALVWPKVTINPTVVKKLLQLHWSKDRAADGAKINPDAAVLVAEYLRLFVIGNLANFIFTLFDAR